MAYNTFDQHRSSDRLEPEEELVCQALKDYDSDPEVASCDDFVATRDLYAAYVNYYQQFKWSNDLPDKLNLVQFGVALRRAFGLTDENIGTHRIKGKPVRGYIGIRGPKSITISHEPGNPKFKRQ